MKMNNSNSNNVIIDELEKRANEVAAKLNELSHSTGLLSGKATKEEIAMYNQLEMEYAYIENQLCIAREQLGR